jgi:hypothetical protein
MAQEPVYTDGPPAWRAVLSTVLWLIVSGGLLTLLQPLTMVFLMIGGLVSAGDPTQSVMDRYRVISVMNFGALIYGALWLGGIIFLLPLFQKANSTKHLMFRFAVGIGVVAGVWGLGYLLQNLLLR